MMIINFFKMCSRFRVVTYEFHDCRFSRTRLSVDPEDLVSEFTGEPSSELYTVVVDPLVCTLKGWWYIRNMIQRYPLVETSEALNSKF